MAVSASDLHWCKSSYSGGTNDNCVEVARTAPTVYVRDTKDHSKGRLTSSADAWAAFVGFAKEQGV
ncbi:DUF397 domain-containing protein [Streptomyces sp. NBC_00091]|uniref:DUF397 domain-containing protein n=1 Tax=Streptomyces sp. NBC_00091 TaxID=2975648 RepID=UPI00225420BE|nr:DUF397 domain-containing protein [Streptomyces sp. NBC_00091]MCX5380784.1 DUF397 domain-containing protein [Streptomyces sp. NBC_00091]